jgi:hypothetical protein
VADPDQKKSDAGENFVPKEKIHPVATDGFPHQKPFLELMNTERSVLQPWESCKHGCECICTRIYIYLRNSDASIVFGFLAKSNKLSQEEQNEIENWLNEKHYSW